MKTLKIAILEDSLPERKLLEIALNRLNASESLILEYRLFPSVSAFLASDDRFSVILSDIHLGSDSGLDLLRLARVEKRPTPIFVLSGDTQSVGLAYSLGAAGFIVKPLTYRELYAKLRVLYAWLGSLEYENL